MNKKKFFNLCSVSLLVAYIGIIPTINVVAEINPKMTTETNVNNPNEKFEPLPEMKFDSLAEPAPEQTYTLPKDILVGTVSTLLELTFFSKVATNEVKVKFPAQLNILTDQLKPGITVTATEISDEWLIHSDEKVSTFYLPLITSQEGHYPIIIGEQKTAEIEVVKPDEKSQLDLENSDSPYEKGQIELENSAPSLNNNEERLESSTRTSAYVSTWDEFLAAYSDNNCTDITLDSRVESIIAPSTATLPELNRDLAIRGTGYTILDFGTNSASNLRLGQLPSGNTAKLRLQNFVLKKASGTILTYGLNTTGNEWTVDIIGMGDATGTGAAFVNLPLGTIRFTGNTNDFTKGVSASTFIVAKNIIVTDEKQFTSTKLLITRTTAVVFNVGSTPEGSVIIDNGTEVNINRTSSTTNTVIAADGADASIQVSGAKLSISATSSATTPTNSNTTISMRGSRPKLSIQDNADVNIQASVRKKGIVMGAAANNIGGSISVENNSSMNVKSELSSAITNYGTNFSYAVNTGSVLNVSNNGAGMTSTDTGTSTLTILGENPSLDVDNATFNLNNTAAGIAANIQGITPKILFTKAKVNINSLGYGLYIINAGSNAELTFDTSEVTIITSNNSIYVIGTTDPSIAFNNTTATISGTTTTSGNRIYLSGTNGKLTVDQSSSVTLHTLGGTGIYLLNNANQIAINHESTLTIADTGTTNAIRIDTSSTSPLLMVSGGSTVDISTTGTLVSSSVANVQLVGNKAKLGVTDNSTFRLSTPSGTSIPTDSQWSTATTNTALALQGDDSSVEVTDSKLDVTITSGLRRGIVVKSSASTAKSSFISNSSQIGINTGSGNALYVDGLAKSSVEISKQSKFEIKQRSSGSTKFPAIRLGRIPLSSSDSTNPQNSTFYVEDQSTVDIEAQSVGVGYDSAFINGALIQLVSVNNKVQFFTGVTINVITKQTTQFGLALVTTRPPTITGATRLTFIVDDANFNTNMSIRNNETGKNAKISVTNNADIKSNGWYVLASSFEVLDGGAVTIKTTVPGTQEEGSFYGDKLKLLISGGSFIINRNTNSTNTGMSLYNGNSSITVEKAGKLEVTNYGDGKPNDSQAGATNAAVAFRNGDVNSFIVRDPGSEVILDAKFGAAITHSYSTNKFDGSITVSNLGYFTAKGNTATNASGVFNGKVLKVTFDNPLYMDFTNYRAGGGRVFTADASTSSLTATNSKLSIWKQGADVEGDPNSNFPTINYKFSGVNMGTLGTTSRPDLLNTSVIGTSGLRDYTRVSSNNANWAIADQLYVPTNADKKIYGHFSVPVGLYDSRNAWDDEITGNVSITREGNVIGNYEVKSVGNTDDYPGISVYGEEPRGGLFEITLDDYLQAGDIVEITDITLTSGELTEGRENINDTGPTKTFPIIPPKPATFDSYAISKQATVIRGKATEGDQVTAKINGIEMNLPEVIVQPDGTFTIPLNDQVLAEGDTIQVFLRDQNGSATNAGVINPPVTNNQLGNINPVEALVFHDAEFPPATELTVIGGPTGTLSFDTIDNWDFGNQELPVTTNGKSYTVPEPKRLEFTDERSFEQATPWTLMVEQINHFTSNENGQIRELNGSVLGFETAKINGTKWDENEPIDDSLLTDQHLVVGSSVPVAYSNQVDNQRGKFTIDFGKVTLDVPGSTIPSKSTYETTLDWTLNVVPGNR